MLLFLVSSLLFTAFILPLAATADATVSMCSLAPSQRLAGLSTLSFASLPADSPYPGYADAAYTDFMTNMYDASHHWLRLQIHSNRPSNYWNTAVALHTLIQYHVFNAARGGKDTAIPLVEMLVQRQRGLNESDAELRNQYNDDMSWMMHALTALYEQTHNASYLDMATLLFDTVKQSDDTSCCGDMKGGVWWDLAHTSKATAAQAGVTMASLRLRETAAPKYSQEYWLRYAEQHFWFWRLHMVDNATAQVCDNINTQGRKSWWSFTYNNGLMLGDAVHLYLATNRTVFLNQSRFLASYLLNTGMNVSVNGSVRRILADDANGGCSGDVSEFHQVGYQYLTEYYSLLLRLASEGVSGREWVLDELCELYDFLQANVDSLWINAHNAENGTYNCNWSGRKEGTVGLQGSMNQAVSAFSLFAALPVPMMRPQSVLSSD